MTTIWKPALNNEFWNCSHHGADNWKRWNFHCCTASFCKTVIYWLLWHWWLPRADLSISFAPLEFLYSNRSTRVEARWNCCFFVDLSPNAQSTTSNFHVSFPFGTVIAIFQKWNSGPFWEKGEVSEAVLALNLILQWAWRRLCIHLVLRNHSRACTICHRLPDPSLEAEVETPCL